MREQDVRATFAALNAHGAPPLAVTAEDLIECGDQVRRRRKRTLAVAGTGLVVAVVLAGVFVALPHRGPGQVTPARTPEPTSVVEELVPPQPLPAPPPPR